MAREQPRQPVSRRPGPLGRLRIYLLRHLQVFFYTLGQLSRRPASMLMTAARTWAASF